MIYSILQKCILYTARKKCKQKKKLLKYKGAYFSKKLNLKRNFNINYTLFIWSKRLPSFVHTSRWKYHLVRLVQFPYMLYTCYILIYWSWNRKQSGYLCFDAKNISSDIKFLRSYCFLKDGNHLLLQIIFYITIKNIKPIPARYEISCKLHSC